MKIPAELIEGGPSYRVKVEGRLLNEEVHKRIQEISIDLSENGADSCTIDMELTGILDFLDLPYLYEEAEIEVEVGYASRHRYTFKGLIAKVDAEFPEGGIPNVSIFCMDESHQLDRIKKTRTFTDMKISDIVKYIGENADIKLDVSRVQETEEVHETIVQREETDMQFLLSLVDRQNKVLIREDKEEGSEYKEHNFVVKVRNGKLLFYDRNFLGTPKRKFWYNSGDTSIISLDASFITNSHIDKLEEEGSGESVDVDPDTGLIVGENIDKKDIWFTVTRDGKLQIIDTDLFGR